MFITAIKSNLYQMMSFLPQVHTVICLLKPKPQGEKLGDHEDSEIVEDLNVAVAFRPQLHTFDQPWNFCGSYFCILLVLRITLVMAK